ncbi:kinase-like domain-containing protein [Ilyonectria robusta]|uniref:kinase-like domain-containing protein n=1 Tax=Ilyonectria robusta TaxID=1079257 RepID=UPI001E8E6667|nr:kinase-like domain-containing protein [Ilyonectria robusta]KAH8737721.1 kinase-like domain-containing protein [Ilyonectria robusta]
MPAMDPSDGLPAPIPEIKPSFTFPAPQVHIDDIDDHPPPLVHHLTEPTPAHRFASPMRHHKRTPSAHREVKETLNAQTEFSNEDADGRTHHRVNQYTILEEIGRGSYGAVHLATDQFGNEYAVKEFSKSRLRKRAQSNILRLGPRGPKRIGPGTPLGAGLRKSESKDALFLIREEVAVMKKLNHPNLVQLIEVLDDPEEDSLYMVLEMCKRGVVMKVGLDEQAEPFDEEKCRFWFRDLILAIEYLHAQGVIHRDIKPDNLLLSDDDVLKVVDFGVSEIFEKPQNMRISKSAGSPAFLPPELCGKHGDVSGTAADIWSMGVSLFCLKYGRIPFNRDGMLDMYDAIKSDEPQIPEDENPDFVDLIRKLLDKNPETRITMKEIRNHAWVTCNGTDPLLCAEDNCVNMVEPPNELEVSRALTRKFNHLLCVMKAIRKFKAILDRTRSETAARSSSGSPTTPQGVFDSKDIAKAEVITALLSQRRKVRALNLIGNGNGDSKGSGSGIGEQETRFLGIGTGARDDFAMDEATPDIVSDSPTAVDFNVYDRAYESAVEQINSAQNTSQKPTVFLTKLVKDAGGLQGGDQSAVQASDLPAQAAAQQEHETSSSTTETLAQLASNLDVSDNK